MRDTLRRILHPDNAMVLIPAYFGLYVVLPLLLLFLAAVVYRAATGYYS